MRCRFWFLLHASVRRTIAQSGQYLSLAGFVSPVDALGWSVDRLCAATCDTHFTVENICTNRPPPLMTSRGQGDAEKTCAAQSAEKVRLGGGGLI